MERVVQTSMRRARWWLAGPSAGQTGRPTGWQARWPTGVGFSSSAAGEERDIGVRRMHQGEWRRKGERWTEHGASDSLCCCLGILNKHIHTLSVSPPLSSLLARLLKSRHIVEGEHNQTLLVHLVLFLQYSWLSFLRKSKSSLLERTLWQGQPSQRSVV